MNHRFSIRDLMWLTLVIALTAGCTPAVKTPEKLTLYSINVQTDRPETGEGRFHRFPVFGRIEITDPADRLKLTTALMDGISRSDKESVLPACFWPRHGISMVMDGQRTEYVICFECVQIQVYSNGGMKWERTTKEAQQLFNNYLTAAGIKLAPPPQED